MQLYVTLGAQRATKILGIFARLDRRDGKPQYLRHMPRIWRYLRRALIHPAMNDLKAWYDAHVLPPNRASDAMRAMVLAAGLGTRMRPLTDTLPKPLVQVAGQALLDHVLDRLADAGVETAVVNVHHMADQIENHLKGRTRPRIVISDERGELLDTGGGVVKALKLLGDRAVPAHEFRHAVDRGRDAEPAAPGGGLRSGAAWTSCCCCASTTASIGYDGRGDFVMAPDGRLARRAERQVAPFVYAGAAMLSPALFADAPKGKFSLNTMFDRAIEAGRLYGQRLEGTWMHVGTPARHRRRRKRRSPKVWSSARAPPYNGAHAARFHDSAHPRRFCSTLIGALRDGRLIDGSVVGDPLALADATLFLPTRRACALAREVFLEALEDRRRRAAAASCRSATSTRTNWRSPTWRTAPKRWRFPTRSAASNGACCWRNSCSRGSRRPSLRTGTGQPLVANSPASALALADALARLMDDMTTRQVAWDRLDDIVPREYDEYWKKSLEFLQIAREVLAGDSRRAAARSIRRRGAIS